VWDEVWWHYASTGSNECDRYVVFSRKGPWTYGTMNRTCGAPKSGYYRLPFAISSTGQFFKHETGVNEDTSAVVGGSVTAINSYVESYDVQLDENGAEVMHISKIVPDNKYMSGTLSVTFKAKNRPEQAAYTTKGPYSITSSTEQQGCRVKGRQTAILYSNNAVGGDWRIGNYTFYVTPDGER
jgi:hypothetical protein